MAATDPTRARTKARSLGTSLSPDLIAKVTAYLTFREVCLQIRPLSTLFRDLCLHPQTWLVWRVEHNVCPVLLDDGPPSSDEGFAPQLFQPSRVGAHVASHKTPMLLPTQLAWLAYCTVGVCPHADLPTMQRFANEIVPSNVVVGADPGVCDFCRRVPADYSCVGCGKLMCSRSKNGCAAKHCSDNAGHYIGLSTTSPPSSTWCYACGSSCDPRDAGSFTLEIAQHLVRRNPERPLLSTSMSEWQITQSCRCPHLDYRVVERFKRTWFQFARMITETNCVCGTATLPPMFLDIAEVRPPWNDEDFPSDRAGRTALESYNMGHNDRPLGKRGGVAVWNKSHCGCQSRNTYLCLSCGVPMCGTDTDGHMHQHSCATAHLLVFGTRTLNTYCFGCCRHLGMGDDPVEAQLCRHMRRVVEERPFIVHHRSASLWKVFDDICQPTAPFES